MTRATTEHIGSLFDPPANYNGQPPFVKGSKTSQMASEQLENKAAKRRKVYEAIASSGSNGLTDEEVQSRLGMKGNTQRPRRRELELSGHVIDSGRLHMTSSNRQATVWVVA